MMMRTRLPSVRRGGAQRAAPRHHDQAPFATAERRFGYRDKMETEAARAIIDANSYMTLATADADGAPWASPVWFAHEQYETFLWMSHPGARHSRNVAARREIAIVIFDSTVSPHLRNAVYVEAVATIVPDAELADAVAVYAARSVARGLETLAREEVSGDAPWRLYRARASAVYVLEDEHDRRVAVQLAR